MTSARIPIAVAVVLALCSTTALCQQESSRGPSQEPWLRDYLPAKVGFLKRLIQERPGPEKSRLIDPNNRWTKIAKDSAFDWIRKTLQRNWLPPDPNVLRKSLVMIQNAFGPNDVAYVQWQANGHLVQVAQMQTILVVCVRPLSPEGAQKKLTKEAGTELARNTIARLVSKEAEVPIYKTQPVKRVKEAITPDMLAASFEHADIRMCADALHGKCAPPELLDEKRHLYQYWWQCINWWTDESEVGLYTLKIRNGPWVPSYNTNFDATWFEGPPSEKKNTK
jgi:hypothetical protein